MQKLAGSAKLFCIRIKKISDNKKIVCHLVHDKFDVKCIDIFFNFWRIPAVNVMNVTSLKVESVFKGVEFIV